MMPTETPGTCRRPIASETFSWSGSKSGLAAVRSSTPVAILRDPFLHERRAGPGDRPESYGFSAGSRARRSRAPGSQEAGWLFGLGVEVLDRGGSDGIDV